MYDQVHSNLLYHQAIQNSKQHLRAKLRHPKVGDEVYLDNSNRFKRASQGPFKILEKCSDVIFKIQLKGEPNSRIQKVHINRLLPIAKRRKYLTDEVTSHENEAADISILSNPYQTTHDAGSMKIPSDEPTTKQSKKPKTQTFKQPISSNNSRYNLRKISQEES